MLSPDLRYGLISIRELYQRCQQLADASNDAATKTSVLTCLKDTEWDKTLTRFKLAKNAM